MNHSPKIQELLDYTSCGMVKEFFFPRKDITVFNNDQTSTILLSSLNSSGLSNLNQKKSRLTQPTKITGIHAQHTRNVCVPLENLRRIYY